jgi:hypothetical protein
VRVEAATRLELAHSLQWNRDLPSFSQPPHLDAAEHWLTTVFFLALDHNQYDWGTALMADSKNLALFNNGTPHHQLREREHWLTTVFFLALDHNQYDWGTALMADSKNLALFNNGTPHHQLRGRALREREREREPHPLQQRFRHTLNNAHRRKSCGP